jgi:hypothetical protein
MTSRQGTTTPLRGGGELWRRKLPSSVPENFPSPFIHHRQVLISPSSGLSLFVARSSINFLLCFSFPFMNLLMFCISFDRLMYVDGITTVILHHYYFPYLFLSFIPFHFSCWRTLGTLLTVSHSAATQICFA